MSITRKENKKKREQTSNDATKKTTKKGKLSQCTERSGNFLPYA